MPITINGNGAISGLGDIDGHDLETATLVVSGDTTIAPQAVGRATLFVDDSTNRVGINTTTPSRILEVSDSEPIVGVTDTGDSVELLLGVFSGNAFVGTESSDRFDINTGGAARLTVAANGNVGINQTTPTFRLDINQPSTYGLRVGGNGGGGYYGLEIGQRNLNGAGGINTVGTNAALVFHQNGDEMARFTGDRTLLVTRNNSNNNTAASVINTNAEQRNQYGFYRIDGIVAGQTVGSHYSFEYTTNGNNPRRMGFFGCERRLANSGDQTASFVMELCPNNSTNVGQSAPNANTTIYRFRHNGVLELLGSSRGIQFGSPNSGGDITSQTLDDYEEGNWTPTLVGNQTSGSPATYTRQQGRYTKVGRLVTVWGQVQIDSWGTQAGFATLIAGLPIAGDNTITYEQGWGLIVAEVLATPTISMSCYMGPGFATTVALRQRDSSSISSDWLAPTFIQTGSAVKFTFSYFAAN